MPQEHALADAYPLAWPEGWPRLKAGGYREVAMVELNEAHDAALRELPA